MPCTAKKHETERKEFRCAAAGLGWARLGSWAGQVAAGVGRCGSWAACLAACLRCLAGWLAARRACE